jgi:hypothetical protein
MCTSQMKHINLKTIPNLMTTTSVLICIYHARAYSVQYTLIYTVFYERIMWVGDVIAINSQVKQLYSNYIILYCMAGNFRGC